MKMTIELISNNYKELVQMVQESVKDINAESNNFAKDKLLKSVIAQVEEIAEVIRDDFDNTIKNIDYEQEEYKYNNILDGCNEYAEPFEKALEELHKIELSLLVA